MLREVELRAVIVGRLSVNERHLDELLVEGKSHGRNSSLHWYRNVDDLLLLRRQLQVVEWLLYNLRVVSLVTWEELLLLLMLLFLKTFLELV